MGVTQNGAGFWESWGTHIINPRSLYYSQLLDRSGIEALGRVALRQQYTGTVWSYLSAWAGEGLLFERVTAGADRSIDDENESLVLNGMVRDLGLLDAGSTIGWTKVSGPGAVMFADPSSPETIVSFSQPGSYVLSLTVDDGISPVSDTVTVAVAITPSVFCLMEDDFEGDTVDTKPSGASVVRPTVNTQNCFTVVVDAETNTAGTGKGVQIRDFNDTTSTTLSYNFVDGTNSHLSAVRAELSFACLDASGAGDDEIFIAFGEYGTGVTLSSSSRRFTDARLYNDGTIAFVSASGADVYNIDISTGAHALTVFANDYDGQTVDYIGPDENIYTLGANSVAYWLDGTLILFGGAEYTLLDLNESTKGGSGTVGTSEDNLGKFGFYSYTASTNLNYVLDDIRICELLPAEPSLYYDLWLELYPLLGAATNYVDDPDLDGMDNLLEYALGGNPKTPDAGDTLPTYDLVEEGGTNWLRYVYNRNVNAADLVYSVNSTPELESEPMTNATQWTGSSDPVDGFKSVTNRIPTDGATARFIGLTVEITE